MQSRRSFVKALAWMFLAAAGGTSLWRLGQNSMRPSSSAAPPAPEADQPTSGGSKNDGPILSFFLLSDIHATATASTTAEKLRTALSDIVALDRPVDAIVLGGDLVDGGRDVDYQVLKETLSAYQLPPVYANMGNHEYYHIWYNANGEWSTATGPNGKTDAQSRERFMKFMGYDHPYHDTWVNGVHLIMLSQETYMQEKPEVSEGAWYSDAQLAWCKERMAEHADGRPAFVFIHQPLPPAGSDGGAHRLIRATEFREIIKPYQNVFVLSGHTHRSLETAGRYVQEGNFHWFSNASVGMTRGNASAPNPVQGLYIQVYPDKVQVAGREFSNGTWIEAAQWTVALT